jgi:hypothetical protein
MKEKKRKTLKGRDGIEKEYTIVQNLKPSSVASIAMYASGEDCKG